MGAPAELTEGQRRALSGHKTAQAYRGYAKETMRRARAATRKRPAHLLAQKQLEEQSIQAGKSLADAYWSLLKGMGCSYEGAEIDLSIGRRSLFSVDVPPSADIYEVYKQLERGQRDKVWMFQEGYAHVPKAWR